MPNTAQYDSSIASITIDEDGIFIFKLKDTYELYNEIEAKKQFDFFQNWSKGKPYKVFVDTKGSLNLPTENAILYFGRHNKPEYKFAVFTLELPIQIFVGQLLKYNQFNNMKLFKDDKDAKMWLLDKK